MHTPSQLADAPRAFGAAFLTAISRRAVGVAKFALAMAERVDPATVAASESELHRLNLELQAAAAEVRRLDHAPDDEFNIALDRASKIVDRMYYAPARTLAGLRMKAEAFDWWLGGTIGAGLEEKGPTDAKFAHTIARDLLAM